MFCTRCLTVFDWGTKKVEEAGVLVHNPIAFDFMLMTEEGRRAIDEDRTGEFINSQSRQVSVVVRTEGEVQPRIIPDP